MRVLKLRFVAVALVFSACGGPEEFEPTAPGAEATPSRVVADAVYTNGRIYTVNERQPWVEAVAIKDGEFLIVGSHADVETVTGSETNVVDLAGRFAMPGIVDLHVHPFATPLFNMINLGFSDPFDADLMLKELKDFAAAHPEKKWIRAGSWGVGVFPDDNPSKELIDAVISDRPVVLIDQTGHNYWVNSKALELAGIDAATPTDDKYVIEKNPVTGEPTGTVRESAMRLIEQVAEWPSPEEWYKSVHDVFAEFNSGGVTTMRTAEGSSTWLDIVQTLDEANDLDMRLFIAWDWHMHITTPFTDEEMDAQIADRAKYASDLVQPNFVKIFLDGTPGGYQVPFVEPYSDGSGKHGIGKFTPEELADLVAGFDAQGIGTFMHSIGDGSARMGLDAIEATRKRNGDSGVRHCIAHLVWVHPDDFPRFAAISGVTASVGPPVPYPGNVFEAFLPLVGRNRMDQMFPAGSLIRAAARPGYGSDWLTVLPPSPWGPMQSLVTRTNPEAPERGELGENETVTIEQAIEMFTLNGAYVVSAEDRIGSVEQGKQADMIVLDRNIFEIDPLEIGATRVLTTVLGGRVVYDATRDDTPDVIDESEYLEAGRVVH